jgi:hypothetical protein
MGVRFEALTDTDREAVVAFTELRSPFFYDM